MSPGGRSGLPDHRGVVVRTALAGIPSYLSGSRYRWTGHAAIGSRGGLSFAWLFVAAAVFVAPLGLVAVGFVVRAREASACRRAVALAGAVLASGLGFILPGALGLR